MLFKANIVPREEYMNDWPAHYFDIKEIDMREACLNQYIREHPDSPDDIRRLELLTKRFGKRGKKERGDHFIKSFMMILIAYKNHFNDLNITRKERELRAELKNLCVLDCPYDPILKAEWENFAAVYLATCATHEYRSTLFGAIKLKDEVIAMRIASEIDAVTRLAPKQFQLETKCENLRQIMIDAYIASLEDGQAYWNAYMTSQKDMPD